MSSAVAEIKKLNDQLSALRQENIVLKVRPTIFGYLSLVVGNLSISRKI